MSVSRIIRMALGFALGLLLGGGWAYSYAAVITVAPTASIKAATSAGSLVASGPASFVSAGEVAVSGGKVATTLTATMGRGTITIPSTFTVANTAGAVIKTAVRLNPTRLVVGTVAAYLITKGLQYIDGKWQAPNTSDPGTTAHYWLKSVYDGKYYDDIDSWCAGRKVSYETATSWSCTLTTGTRPSWDYKGKMPNGATPNGGEYLTYGCRGPSGAVTCGTPGMRDAIEGDWKRVPDDASWPDDALKTVTGLGVPVPFDAPDMTQPPDVPLSDPYYDPVTGKRYKDVAKVTPQPNDPLHPIVQVVKVEVDAAGQPTTNTDGTPKTPEANPDPCASNPNRVGCMDSDTPEGPDITKNDKNISITPDAGWGPDSGTCPADRVEVMRTGTYRFSYEGPCQVATGFKPIVIALAWVGAVLIAIGITKRYG